MTTTTHDTQAAADRARRENGLPVIGGLLRALGIFGKALRHNPAGLVGFLGLLFFALFTTIGPRLIPFDAESKLDQIAAPPGSRVVLLARAEDADRIRTLSDLTANDTLGFIEKTAGERLINEYLAGREAPFTTETYRFRSGRGVQEAFEGLSSGEVDALVAFSRTVNDLMVRNRDAGQLERLGNLVVVDPQLGPPHLLGTDTQGRDIFSHIVHGGSTLIFVAVMAGLFSTMIAVVLGGLAALLGGVIDRVLVSAANFVLTIPGFPLLVVLALLVGQQLNNPLLLAGLIAALSWPVLMRAVRAQVLSLREREFVEAAQALGMGLPHIIFREILPNMMSFVAISFIFAVTSAMYQQVGLIFLGMAPINDYSWGVMLFFGRTRGTLFSPDSMSMVLAPVIAIALFQVSMVLFARALEEMFDPRLKTA